MKTETRPELSFDGHGINGSDAYRSRIATFSNSSVAETYGPLFAAAPETRAALQAMLDAFDVGQPAGPDSAIAKARAVIGGNTP